MPLDYVAVAQSRLTSVFSEKPLVTALVKAMVTPFVGIEDVADSLKTERWIATAIGAQLDGCGYIVGEPRLGRTDEEYRAAINFRIFVNTSNATPEDLIAALKFLTESDNVQYIEQYPASAMLFSDSASISASIQSAIQDLSPAAIDNVNILVNFSRRQPFRFDLQSTTTENNLGGVVPAELWIENSQLELSDGSILVINNEETDILLDSGFHLTGVYA